MGLRERLVASAAEIRTRSQRLVELNVELLTAELKRKGQEYGSAIGMFVGAGVLALYALGFALTTITVALALVLPLWLALLIVTVVLLLIVLILALVGRSRLRRVKSPSPQRAIGEAKATVDTLKSNFQQTVNELAPRRNGGSSGSLPPAGTGATPRATSSSAGAPSPSTTPPTTPGASGPTTPPPTTPPPPATPPGAAPGAPTSAPGETPPSDDEVS